MSEREKADEQTEAKLAFCIAVLAQLFALFGPGGPGLWRPWWAELNAGISGAKAPALMTALFFLCVNVLWLISPFLTRVYSQSTAMRNLVLILSVAAVIWFYLFSPERFSPYAILLAAGAHLVGVCFIRKPAASE